MAEEPLDYYHLEISHIKAETSLSLLCVFTRIGDTDLDNWDLWVPKSVILDDQEYSQGDVSCSMCIMGWWVKKEGFLDN